MSRRRCFNCGQIGHIARYCNVNREINDSNNDGDVYEEIRICYRCYQLGHVARDCNKLSQSIRCDRCKRFGHIARDCEIEDACSDCNETEYEENNYSQPKLNIDIRKGYLTNQHVDVIVVCSTSEILRESVLEAVSPLVRNEYEQRKNARVEHQSFAVQCPNLPCREILFLPWLPQHGPRHVFNEYTIKKFMSDAIAYVLSRNHKTVAFPAIGCGQFGLNVDFIAETMINHVKIERYPLHITFVIHPQANNVFDAFRNVAGANLITHILPDVWCYTNNHNTGNLRFPVMINTLEWHTIVREFNKTMLGNYKRINRIEHIQNDRWHKQYLIHRDDFQHRLKMNTEKFLYHGCPNTAADRIINEYFNRSFAGINGTNYGYGVYFSTRANYSHFFALPDQRGQRCMFFARVLTGYPTLGSKNMKVCPANYHTTTDGEHIYVTYHDTQAYGQYLIHYQ